MGRFFVHVGYPKTGTTTLDLHVYPNLPETLYLSPLLRVDPLLPLFEVDILSKDQIEYDSEYVARVFQVELERHWLPGDRRRILLANHSLSFTWKNAIDRTLVARRLADLFRDVKILITIRHQFAMIESMYRHLIAQGSWLSFATFLDGMDTNLHRSPLPQLKYYEYIRLYNDLFGQENVTVLCFEELRDEPGRFLARMMDWLEIPGYSPPLPPQENASLSTKALFLKRCINRLVPHGMGRPLFYPGRRRAGEPVSPSNFQHQFRANSNAVVRKLERIVRCKKGTLCYPPGWRHRLERIYADSNRKLFTEFRLPLDLYNYPGVASKDSCPSDSSAG